MHVKDLAQDVAEDVLGAAKDGSDSAQDVAVDVLGGSIRREGFYLAHRQGKSRTCCIISPVIPRCPATQSASEFIHTLAPQAAPRVEPEFPLSLWISVRRDMLARMVTVTLRTRRKAFWRALWRTWCRT